METVSGIIAAGIDEGEMRQEISPRETALTFTGMIQCACLRWTMGGTWFDIQREAEQLWRNFLLLNIMGLKKQKSLLNAGFFVFIYYLSCIAGHSYLFSPWSSTIARLSLKSAWSGFSLTAS